MFKGFLPRIFIIISDLEMSCRGLGYFQTLPLFILTLRLGDLIVWTCGKTLISFHLKSSVYPKIQFTFLNTSRWRCISGHKFGDLN